MAGELETALQKNNNVFLYLYTADCGYCRTFSPVYNKLSGIYSGRFTFIKEDAAKPYGYELLRRYNGRYVPYVLLINPDKAQLITPACLSDNVCLETTIKNF